MSLTERIDNILNQYPHLSEQQAADLVGRSAEENLQELYPNLTAKQIQAFLKDKPAPDVKTAAAPKKRKARPSKAKAVKAIEVKPDPAN